MVKSPFAFYRGAAAIMAADLAATPGHRPPVQLCGDAHLANFGGFAAPERGCVFDVNDFDETLPGPLEWDVKRLAASFAVAGRDRGFDDGSAPRASWRPCGATARRCAGSPTMRTLDVWYARLDVDDAARRAGAEVARRAAASGSTRRSPRRARKDNLRALAKLTATRRRRRCASSAIRR